MKFTNAASGRILETLTSGLYDGNSNCIREYVQNAIDSNSKEIEISYANEGNDIIIRDFGSGMNENELRMALLLGTSPKGGSLGGWRGIGIYSGVPNFDKIYINTKGDDGIKHHIEINCTEIRKNYRREIPIEELLEIGVPGEILSENDIKFKQGTQLILSGIVKTQTVYFEEKNLKEYLEKTLPLKLKNTPLNNKIREGLEKFGLKEFTHTIKFIGKEIFRPPLDDGLFRHSTLSFTPFIAENKTIAVAWSVMAEKNDALEGVHKGIIFKKKGYTIGNSDTVRNTFRGFYNYWQYGEIHILDEQILENSARNNFEINSGHTGDLITLTGEYIQRCQKNNHKKSAYKQDDKLKKAKESLAVGDTKGAEKKIEQAKRALTVNVSGAADGELKEISQQLEEERKKNLEGVKEIEKELKAVKGSTQTAKVNEAIETLPPKERSEVREVIYKTDGDIVKHWLSDIEKKVKTLTGLKHSEFMDLMKDAFGTNFADSPTTVKGRARLLLFDPEEFKKNANMTVSQRKADLAENYPYYVTAGFGALLYEFYNVFVNGAKHNQQLINKLWFDKTNELERANFYIELKQTLRFLENILEKVVPNKNFKKGSP